ncbi:MAG: 30S ribosomal protein S6 [bacterium]|nr:30S ribosomal protein S6 [bacterium]
MKAIIYELAYLISGQIDENQAQELAKKIEKKLEENSVILGSIEPKKIKLAYIIKKQQDGYLMSVDFTSDPKNLIEISKEMEKETDVLRFLTIKKSPEKQKEQREEPILRKPAEQKIVEEKTETSVEPVVREKKKKETLRQAQGKPVEKEHKEEDLKKIEKDLDEILGIPDEDEPKAKSKE